METNEKTSSRTTQEWRSQKSINRDKTQGEQPTRVKAASRPSRDKCVRSDRSDWRGRDPFGSTSDEAINRLIESVQADIDESRKIIARHSEKIERLLKKLENLKYIQSIQSEELEQVKQEKSINEKE